jgi:hypothetical protein
VFAGSVFDDLGDCVMQGFERADRQLLDAEMLAEHLVQPGNSIASLSCRFSASGSRTSGS